MFAATLRPYLLHNNAGAKVSRIFNSFPFAACRLGIFLNVDPSTQPDNHKPMAEDRRKSSISGNSSTSHKRLTPARRAAAAAARARSGNGVADEVSISIKGKGSSTQAPLATADVLQEFGKAVSRTRDLEAEE
jgi:hypothetical protein